MKKLLLPLLAISCLEAQNAGRIHSLKVTVLSTMLADAGIGEWGFSALVTADGRQILFDTGARPDTVLANSREMKIDLARVEQVILSHNHADHTGGLLKLRRELSAGTPSALSVAHVSKGIFLSRPQGTGEGNTMIAARKEYEAGGGKFIEHATAEQIFPGAWLTGPVPRKYPERNWTMGGKTGQVRMADGSVAEDTVPEDQSLVLDTDRGLVVITGCAHAGIINTLDYARHRVREAPTYAVIGGMHLFETADDRVAWTGGMLREFGLANLLGAHCTGIEAVYRLRQATGLERRNCLVGAVGATFDLDEGIKPGRIAR
jgi:7,8-dihydropterin-6-yl-methyl-4-(beta-D-ribofuranosyl)aminobenzene 5'-phosphate synthase